MNFKIAWSFLLLSILLLMLLSNCAPQKDGVRASDNDSVPITDSLKSFGTTAAKVASEPRIRVDEKFQQQLADVFSSYINLKETLVESDSAKISERAKEVRSAISKIDLKLLAQSEADTARQYVASLKNSLAAIDAFNTMDKQRRAFSALSDSLYMTIKAFGLGGKSAYYDFCPMAFNEEGAFWLSDHESIRNPYFGDQMLTCGEVKEKLK
jgi:hypothetical protein